MGPKMYFLIQLLLFQTEMHYATIDLSELQNSVLQLLSQLPFAKSLQGCRQVQKAF